MEKTVVPEAAGVDKIGFAGWTPQEQKLIVTDLVEGMPADKAGLKEGDQILTVDGQPVSALASMIETLKVSKDKPLTLSVLRNGKPMTFTVQPVLYEKSYRIGIGSLPMKVKTLPFAEALKLSLHDNRQNALLILELVKKMAQGKISPRSIEGPIRIGQAAG